MVLDRSFRAILRKPLSHGVCVWEEGTRAKSSRLPVLRLLLQRCFPQKQGKVAFDGLELLGRMCLPGRGSFRRVWK